MIEKSAPEGVLEIDPQSDIELDGERLRSDEFALGREWLVTNGIGGYASASLAGANTRRYHGLLVAALDPPLGRAVLLSKLDETLEVRMADDTVHSCPLAVNVYPGALYPQGHHTLTAWHARPVPTWTWEPLPGVRLERRIWMARGQNTTYIAYRLVALPPGATARLTLVPLLAWRDYHSEMRACDTVLDAHWQAPDQGASHNATPGSLRLTLPPIQRVTAAPSELTLRLVDAVGAPSVGAAFDVHTDWYHRFQHPREAERGLDHEEDLYTPGTFAAPIGVGDSCVVIASVEAGAPSAPDAALRAVEAAEAKLLGNVGANDAFTRQLALASDAFIVQAPGGRSTIIAGYPWFSDWGRDTMIALPGLCLTTGRAEVAAEILRSFAAYVDRGMIPNRFPDVGERPEYNTVDATLWYVVAIYRYVESTGDVALLRETLWPALQEIVRCHREGTRYGIHMDPEDGLLYAGQPGVQLTWMDAKVGDWVVTPRIGKPVEINALWHSALAAMATFAERLGEDAAQAEYAALARTAATQFAARYTRLDGRGLYDVLDTPGGGPDMAIRPNQVFALSLPLAPLDPTSPLARAIVLTVQQELYTPCGLRTLSPRDPAYRPRYEGDPLNRDRAYHQGTVWPWLMGPYVEACYRVTGNRERAIGLLRPLMDELTAYGIGSLAEVYDGGTPQRPNGCIAQAWSVSETLRVWKQLQAVPEDAP